ncbi:hypothetical protein Pan44_10910 [Caulifigura coniformis]|uniref:Neuromedin U n=1 Tax=Caulifigura coniformis TaxID=2527983 RepID=A0A517SAH4_9PLAN|nr:hypothetical protein [Caulifigura coniformis]QDT53076.1 hypothetical protein Pan44_10910 [Caulifigura coniformis]
MSGRRLLRLVLLHSLLFCAVTHLAADEPTAEMALNGSSESDWLAGGLPSGPPLDLALTLRGQDEGGGGDLASKSQNPVSDLASVPIQNNFDFGIGSEDRTRYIGNLQPVVPLKLNEDWNLISRAIIPFENVPIGIDERADGIGNIVGQFFFSPRNDSEFTWGVGPSIIFPTASEPTLGSDDWGTGVCAVGLISAKPIVAGALVNQMFTTRGASQPFLFQPFFNYNLPKGYFLSLIGEANADWQQDDKNRWSIVAGPGAGRVFPLFGQPLNVSCRFAPYLASPSGGPDWQFRLAVAMLFPR